MRKNLRCVLKRILVLACVGVFSFSSYAGDNDWRPVTPEEMKLKSPKVEPDADSEALFWDVYVADELEIDTPRTVLSHYIRIKVFTEKGRQDNSRVDIPFGKISDIGININVWDIEARTIKPDGSIVVLQGKDIFEREIEKSKGVKFKVKAFALPGIEVGSIIEYKWKESRGDTIAYYDRFEFARDIPVQVVRYHLKPLTRPWFTYGMRTVTFNGTATPFTKDPEKLGYFVTSMINVPSYREEPGMPPKYAIKPWLLVYYSQDRGKIDPKDFWKDFGKEVFNDHKSQTKVTDAIIAATTLAIGKETDPLKKLERIFYYCRDNIKDINDDVSGMTPDQIKAFKDNKNAADTLKKGAGDIHDINMVFMAMAKAAGFEARVTSLPKRSDANFSMDFTDSYFMRSENIAVKVGDEWKFFDPGARYMPFGMLRWDHEGQPALISDSKEPIWTTIPVSPPANSLKKRSGKFRLNADGDLEGEINIQFSGHLAMRYKELNDDVSEQARIDQLRDMVKQEILATVEIFDPFIANVTDPDRPIVYQFKVKIPGYASKTGKRLFFQPNVFERSSSPLFTADGRRYNIFIDHPWAENDSIEIELPEGYYAENPDSPGRLEDSKKLSLNDIKIGIAKDGKKLFYNRNFYFGDQNSLAFSKESYPGLKNMFDAYNKANTHQMILREGAPPAPLK